MNLLTLNDILADVSRHVENGKGACNPTLVAERVSDACERLIVKADWPYTTMKFRARVDRAHFPLPREIESIIACNIDNEAATLSSQMFEFMEAGPGELKSWEGTGKKDLEDAGLFCTMYDVPALEYPSSEDAEKISDTEFEADGLNIMAFGTSAADAGKLVYVSGLDKTNTPVSSDATAFNPLEPIPVVQWTGGVEGQLSTEIANLPKSKKLYRSVTAFSKPVTASHICLYAVQPSTGRMWFLAKAHPEDKNPAWRRYAVRNQSVYGANILAYGKVAALRLVRPTDILPIQNRGAIRLMVQAIEYENKGQLKSAVEMESQAMRLLMEQKADHDNRGMSANVVDFNLECSNVPTNRLYSR